MLTEELVTELKAKHGKLCAVEINGADFVFRKPRRVEYDRWYDKYSGSSAQKSAASYELACATLVHPKQDELRAALEAEPAALCTLVDTEIIKLAGAGQSTEGKARAL